MRVKMDIKDLKEITNLLLTLVSEAKFEFSNNGISVKAVDPAHVAMIVLNVSKEAFLEFEAEEEELGVDLDKVRDILRLASSGDVVEISKEGSKLTFLIGNLTRSMPLIDTSAMSVPKVPNLVLPAKVILPVDEFEHGIKAAESISDNITLRITPTEFEMYTQGDEDTARLTIPKDMLKELSCDEPVKSMYPVDYLLKLVKAMDSAEYLTIYVGTDYPIKIEFDITGGKGQGAYLLAPRIEGE
ncbi:DNA polymerase sliding clamp [Euryarchaeota archaeon ex4484_178]|nr:MAG: DNA polymerase sliding clamp [Euryarchaeota archaeon ex4484_178]